MVQPIIRYTTTPTIPFTGQHAFFWELYIDELPKTDDGFVTAFSIDELIAAAPTQQHSKISGFFAMCVRRVSDAMGDKVNKEIQPTPLEYHFRYNKARTVLTVNYRSPQAVGKVEIDVIDIMSEVLGDTIGTQRTLCRYAIDVDTDLNTAVAFAAYTAVGVASTADDVFSYSNLVAKVLDQWFRASEKPLPFESQDEQVRLCNERAYFTSQFNDLLMNTLAASAGPVAVLLTVSITACGVRIALTARSKNPDTTRLDLEKFFPANSVTIFKVSQVQQLFQVTLE